jgi:hypothetical protein
MLDQLLFKQEYHEQNREFNVKRWSEYFMAEAVPDSYILVYTANILTQV